ncbi:MAG TPA: hypothetical protein VKX40_04985 [Aequorivita sp.]|nr:hypothetical protein [Aequorivita sp.]
MGKSKKIILVLTIIILTFIVIGFWYRAEYSMKAISQEQIHSDRLETKILIATQGSDFKRAIVTNIKNHYSLDSVFLKIVDVKELIDINPQDYDAVVILHTWEYGNPPSSVKDFIMKNQEYKQKFVVLATSGQGTNRIEGIDALSGESIIVNASDYSDEIIGRIAKIIKSSS